MKTTPLYYLLIAAFLISLNSCMMFMHGGMQHDNHDSSSIEQSIVKDVSIGKYHIIAEFPPLQQHQETNFTLKIFSSKDSLWIRATIRLEISEGNEDDGKPAEVVQLLSPSENNMYEYAFTPHEEANYNINFIVEQIDSTELPSLIFLSADRFAKPMTMEHSEHSSFELSPMMLVGGIAMLAMMVVMFGRIF